MSVGQNTELKSGSGPGRSVTAICVQPIGVDLVAATAFDTLARKMGHGNSLESLRRETVWLLSFGCEPARAAALTAALAVNTGIFVNPNTHRHVVVAPADSIPHGVAEGREAVGVGLWTYDDPQVRPIESAVRERTGVTELVTLKKMTLWWPRMWRSEAGERSSTDAILSMVATRSRKEGLLANPHSEGWYLVESPQTPAMMLAVLEDTEKRLDSFSA